jgi:peptidoglycan/LPS O-acetylase OafA/YrhL
MSWKMKVSFILLLAAIVYVFMAPDDFLPFTFFDNLGFIVVAVIIWILVVLMETGGEKPNERKQEL